MATVFRCDKCGAIVEKKKDLMRFTVEFEKYNDKEGMHCYVTSSKRSAELCIPCYNNVQEDLYDSFKDYVDGPEFKED